MNKYEVGYEDELIGVYYAENEEEAKQLCKDDMCSIMAREINWKPETSTRDRLHKGLIVNKEKL